MTDPAELVDRAIDRAIERLQSMATYAGRPSWETVIREELATLIQAQADEIERLREDAERWRALLNCRHISLFGWAGLDKDGEPMPDRKGIVHFEGGFHSHCSNHYPETTDLTKKVVTAFADACRARTALGGDHE